MRELLECNKEADDVFFFVRHSSCFLANLFLAMSLFFFFGFCLDTEMWIFGCHSWFLYIFCFSYSDVRAGLLAICLKAIAFKSDRVFPACCLERSVFYFLFLTLAQAFAIKSGRLAGPALEKHLACLVVHSASVSACVVWIKVFLNFRFWCPPRLLQESLDVWLASRQRLPKSFFACALCLCVVFVLARLCRGLKALRKFSQQPDALWGQDCKTCFLFASVVISCQAARQRRHFFFALAQSCFLLLSLLIRLDFFCCFLMCYFWASQVQSSLAGALGCPRAGERISLGPCGKPFRPSGKRRTQETAIEGNRQKQRKRQQKEKPAEGKESKQEPIERSEGKTVE